MTQTPIAIVGVGQEMMLKRYEAAVISSERGACVFGRATSKPWLAKGWLTCELRHFEVDGKRRFMLRSAIKPDMTPDMAEVPGPLRTAPSAVGTED